MLNLYDKKHAWILGGFEFLRADETVEANAGSGGSSFAVDNAGVGGLYPYTKVAFGASGTQTAVSDTNPLPVGGSGAAALGKAEDAAHTTGDVGVPALAVRRDAEAVGSGADGDYSTLNVDASGRLRVTGAGVTQPVSDAGGSLTVDGTVSVSGTVTVDGSGATQPVSAVSLPLPTGAATAAKQPALGTAGSASGDVITIQGVASMTPVQIADNGGSLTVDGSVSLAAAIPAGTSLIGRVSASAETSTIYNGTTALTPKFAIIDAASSGDNTLVAAVASNKIRVLACFMVAAGAVNARFESGAGGTALSGQMNLGANGGFCLPYNPVGWFETGVNTLLNLELSGAVSVDGSLVYVEVP